MLPRRTLVHFAVVMLLIGLTGGLLAHSGWPGIAASSPTPREAVLGDVPISPPARPATQVAVIGADYPSDLNAPPTADKDQSKLWFHSASWWGILVDAEGTGFRIHRLNWADQAWVDTGVVVDDRLTARADVLWTGAHLFVASAGSAARPSEHVRLSRYTYAAGSGRHDLDAGFPVVLTERGVESLTISADSSDGLWVSYIVDGHVWIRHSSDAGLTWTSPMRLAQAGDDVTVHTIVPYGDTLAAVWSNQSEGTVSYATHVSGEPPDAWSTPTTVVEGAFLADDHVSARSLDGPDGASLFVMVKTSQDLQPDPDPTAPQMLLIEVRPDGDWHEHVVGRVRDRHTRPLLLIDEAERQLHIFVVAPFGKGSVYYKSTSADDIQLAPGQGAPFLDLPDHGEITNPTSTKQNLTPQSGLIVLASDEETSQYVMGALP